MTECKHSNTKNGELVNLTSYEFCLDCGMSRSVWEQGGSVWQWNAFALSQEYNNKECERLRDVADLKMEAIEANDIIVELKAENEKLSDAYKYAVSGLEQISRGFIKAGRSVEFASSIDGISKHVAECEEIIK